MKDGKLRNMGAEVIGDALWGTHFCLFYQTKEDLIDILVPYFKAGLENNEFCMWVTSEPLNVEDAERALQRVVENLDSYVEKGQIEILDYRQWYTKSGRFDADEVLQGWVGKEAQAVKRGFDGLRLTGNTFWLEERDWEAFTEYEAAIDHVIGNYRMLALCTYSLDRCRASEAIDVVSNHEFALIKREGKWETIESARRKQAEEALRESEQRYRQLFEGISDAVMVYSSQGRFLDCNEATLQRLGYSRGETLHVRAADIVHPDFHQVMKNNQKRIWAGETTVVESAHRCKDGRVVPVEVSARRIEYQGESAILAVVRDITERKRAEEVLWRREQEIRMIADNVPALVSYVDADGLYRFVNKQYEEWFAVPRTEIVGKHYRQVLGEDTYEAIKDCVDAALSGQGVRYEEALPYATGGTRWVLADYVPDADDQGKVRGFFALVTDITERKRAEETLRRRNEESAILNAIAAVVSQSLDLEEVLDAALGKTLAALNADGGLIYLFDETSQTFAPVVHHGISQDVLQEVTGFKPGEGLSGHVAKSGKPLVTAPGKDAGDISPSGVREGLRSYAGVPIRSRGKVFGVMTLVAYQEDYFKPEHVSLLSHIGNQIGVAIENARLFEQVQAGRERLRRLTQQIVSAQEEERQRLARELHDELGQALTAIGFDLAAIERELPPEVAPTVREKLAETKSLAARADKRVSELALDLRPYMLDDLGLVSTLRWYANRYAKRLDIEVEMEAIGFQERLTPEVETALYRVVQEALTNVAKHAQANQVRIRLERKEAAVAAIVEDDGQGFDVETMAGPTAPERGAGLLGIQERANFLGGTLSIESTPGQGTRLMIEVPI